MFDKTNRTQSVNELVHFSFHLPSKLEILQEPFTNQSLIKKIYKDIFTVKNEWMDGNAVKATILPIEGKMHWLRQTSSDSLQTIAGQNPASHYHYLRTFYAYLIGALTISTIFDKTNPGFIDAILAIQCDIEEKFKQLSQQDSDIVSINCILQESKQLLIRQLEQLVSCDHKTINTMLDQAKDWAALEEDSYIISTRIDIPVAGRQKKVLILDEPCTALTQEQIALFDNLDQQPWFQELAHNPFKQKLIRHYLPRILSQNCVIPSQLRAILPLGKNSYRQSLWVENEQGDMVETNAYFHSGTPAHLSHQADDIATTITANNLVQQKMHAGTDSSVMISLNSRIADTILQPIETIKGNRYTPDDSKITTLIPKAAKNVTDHNIFYSKICLNGFRWLEAHEYEGINHIITLIQQNIQILEPLFPEQAQILSLLIMKILSWENTYWEYEGKGINIIYFLTQLIHKNNALAAEKKDLGLKTAAIWFGCASGENRTGITYLDILCQSLLDSLREQNLPLTPAEEAKLIEYIAYSGHCTILTGNQGSTLGTEGFRAKSSEALRSKLGHIKSAVVNMVADQKNIALSESMLAAIPTAIKNEEQSYYDPDYNYEIDDILELLNLHAEIPENYDIDDIEVLTLQHRNFHEPYQLKDIAKDQHFFLRQQLRDFLKNKNTYMQKPERTRRLLIPIITSGHWVTIAIEQQQNRGTSMNAKLAWQRHWTSINQFIEKFPGLWETAREDLFDNEEEVLNAIMQDMETNTDAQVALKALYKTSVYIYETTTARLEASDDGNPAVALWPQLNATFNLSKETTLSVKEINALTHHQLAQEQAKNSQDCGPLQTEICQAFIEGGDKKVQAQSKNKRSIAEIRANHFATASPFFQERQRAVDKAFAFLDIDRTQFLNMHVRTRKNYLIFKRLLKELSYCQEHHDLPLDALLSLSYQAEKAFETLSCSSLMYNQNEYSIHSRGISELHDFYADEATKVAPKESGVEPGFIGICVKDLLLTLLSYYPDNEARMARMQELAARGQNLVQELCGIFEQHVPKYLLKNDFQINEANEAYLERKDVNRTSKMKKIYQILGGFLGNCIADIYVHIKKDHFSQKNLEAVVEVLANDLAGAFGMKTQKQTLYPANYANGLTKLMLKGLWVDDAETLGPLEDGYRVKTMYTPNDEKVLVSENTIKNLNVALPFFLCLCDYDGIGSKGQNKLCHNQELFGIDFGHAFQNMLDIDALNDDFSFDFAYFNFSNYSIFYDCPRREFMRGIFRLARLNGCLNDSHDKFIASYGDGFYKELFDLDDKADARVFDDYIKIFNRLCLQEQNEDNKKGYQLIVEHLDGLKNLYLKQRNAVLYKFINLLEVEAEAIDLMEYCEKIWAGKEGTSLYSKEKTVLLNHLRITAAKPVKWQVDSLGKQEYQLIAIFDSTIEAQNAWKNLRDFDEESMALTALKNNTITFSSKNLSVLTTLFHEERIIERYHNQDYQKRIQLNPAPTQTPAIKRTASHKSQSAPAGAANHKESVKDGEIVPILAFEDYIKAPNTNQLLATAAWSIWNQIKNKPFVSNIFVLDGAIDLKTLEQGYYVRFIQTEQGFHLYGVEITADKDLIVHENIPRERIKNHGDFLFRKQLKALNKEGKIVFRVANKEGGGLNLHSDLCVHYAEKGAIGTDYENKNFGHLHANWLKLSLFNRNTGITARRTHTLSATALPLKRRLIWDGESSHLIILCRQEEPQRIAITEQNYKQVLQTLKKEEKTFPIAKQGESLSQLQKKWTEIFRQNTTQTDTTAVAHKKKKRPNLPLYERIHLLTAREDIIFDIKRLQQNMNPLMRSADPKIKILMSLLRKVNTEIANKGAKKSFQDLFYEVFPKDDHSHWYCINTPRNRASCNNKPQLKTRTTTAETLMRLLRKPAPKSDEIIDLEEKTQACRNSKIEDLIHTFVDRYLQQWRDEKSGPLGFMKKKGIKDFSMLTLASIIKHAETGQRTRDILIKLHWINAKGIVHSDLKALLSEELAAQEEHKFHIGNEP